MNPSNSNGDVELRNKIDATNLKYMHNTGWNGHKEAEVYQAAMGEIMQLIQKVRAQAEHVAFEAVARLNDDYDLTVTGHQAHRNAVANLVFERRCDWERFESKHPTPSNPEQLKEQKNV